MGWDVNNLTKKQFGDKRYFITYKESEIFHSYKLLYIEYDIKLINVYTVYLPAIGAPAVLAIPEAANTIPSPVGYVFSPTNSRVVMDITVTTPPRAIP